MGSRVNYFDVHDVDEVASKYMKANFGSQTDLEAELRQRDRTIRELSERVKGLEVLHEEKIKLD